MRQARDTLQTCAQQSRNFDAFVAMCGSNFRISMHYRPMNLFNKYGVRFLKLMNACGHCNSVSYIADHSLPDYLFVSANNVRNLLINQMMLPLLSRLR